MPIGKESKKAISWADGLRIPVLGFSLAFQIQFAVAATCISKPTEDILVVLDVGHTATNPGATSARGVREYDFNVKLAQRVKEQLLLTGFSRTHLMVTQANGTSGLNQRADRANDMDADLFVSIHHDAVRDEYLTPWLYQGDEHLFFDGAKGFSLHVSTYGESLRLARIIADRLLGSGLNFTTVHQPSNPAGARVPFADSARGIYLRDGLVVLNRTKMPAVLVESGVIVNRDEELMLASSAHHALAAKAIAEAVREFCGPRETPSYRVINVAPDDVLNIRSGPGAHHPKIDSIPPNGRGLRIVSGCEGQWCAVDYNGVRGWVNRQFLGPER
jgi:N-acetylmuramoyl-L-alanine amidase